MDVDSTKSSAFRTIFGMMMNPLRTINNSLSETKWKVALLVSTLAFGLFFIQTGIDLYKTGQKGFTFIFLSCLTGCIYGLVVIPILAILIWLVLKMVRTDKTVTQVIAFFCLSYSGALIYGILGLVFSLVLGWKTSVAFGVTGVLWAIGPMIVSIREFSGGKNVFSVIVSTAISVLVLISWSVLGNL